MEETARLQTNTFDPGTSGILASGRLFKIRTTLWAAFLFAIASGFFFASVFGASWLGLHGDWFYVPPIVLPALACWVYVVLVRKFETRGTWEFEMRASLLAEGLIGFLFGGVYITTMWALLWALRLYSIHRGVWTRWFDDMVFDSYISAVLEELAFRAVLLRIFARLWGVRTGVLLSSLLFGLAHFTHGSWLGILGIAVNAGVAMGLLYVITGRLWMSIGMHLGYDFIETSVLGVGSHHGFLISTPKADDAVWLTGGSFGPDAAIPGMIVGLVMNIVLWRVAFGTHGRLTVHAATDTALAGNSSPEMLESDAS